MRRLRIVESEDFLFRIDSGLRRLEIISAWKNAPQIVGIMSAKSDVKMFSESFRNSFEGKDARNYPWEKLTIQPMKKFEKNRT